MDRLAVEGAEGGTAGNAWSKMIQVLRSSRLVRSITTLRLSKLRSRIGVGALLLGLGFGGSLVALPALASSPSYMTTTVPLRWCSNFNNPGCNTAYTVYAGEHVTMVCWVDANWYDGTNRWFEVYDYGGDFGLVSANMVANQTSVGHC